MGAQRESFKRYVEVGRVVLLNAGPSEGKLAVIVEIVDHNRAIIDGPSTGVERQVYSYKNLTLTPHTIKGLPRAAGTPAVKKAFEKSDVAEKWAQSAWAKKREALKTRRAASDFERFNIMLLKKQRRRVVGAALKKVSA
ncbi:putative RPL14B-ribosomal protein [Violaceomyces palustris]|uniref:RPL14B-ribosomal protein n=1 Tax=Violaceomyces palustris TaxID=1673888 RepID=A0ACD0NT24_9BASI|nr:putative RPL14B-ribosomal protein [Violaceomyces palustris]